MALQDRIGTVPVEYRGNVYFGCADHYFYCLEAETGKVVWKFRTSNINWCNPAVSGGKILFGSTDCHFYALDALSGEKVWVFEASTLSPSKFREWERVGGEITIEPDAPEGGEEEKDYEVSLSAEEKDSGEYAVKTQYATESEYRVESEYG